MATANIREHSRKKGADIAARPSAIRPSPLFYSRMPKPTPTITGLIRVFTVWVPSAVV